jgi:hypothetical protein
MKTTDPHLPCVEAVTDLPVLLWATLQRLDRSLSHWYLVRSGSWAVEHAQLLAEEVHERLSRAFADEQPHALRHVHLG